MNNKKIYLNWKVGYKSTIDEDCKEYMEASVPGAVQLDWANANNLTNYWYGDNYKKFLWTEDKYWIYISEINFQCHKNERAILVFKGIDYKYIIKINGEIMHEGEGMFTAVHLDVTKYAFSQSQLEVIIFPPPKATQAEDRTQARESCKPAVSYGWDWHPRLIPSGIWDEAYLEILSYNHIKSLKLYYDLNCNLTTANINIDIDCNDISDILIEVFDGSSQLQLSKNTKLLKGTNLVQIRLDNPKLWWPIGYGQQNMYKIKVSVIENNNPIQCITKGIGFRKVKLVMNEGEWDKPMDFPKSCSTVPITVEINGIKIFAKGSNWVNPEIFPGIIKQETYESLLTLVAEANMNMLRVWGGGIVNKDSFYELCDYKGIMVWQEFLLACNCYPDDGEYLKVLNQESISIIERLREHPSLVIWCGGNELFNTWSEMTNQAHALRLLNKNCYEYDRTTPFLMTSPLYGMAHGHYHNVTDGKEFIGELIKSENTAYTEFGCPGPSSSGYIKSFMTEEEYVNCEPGTTWEEHHAFNAWNPEDTWLRKSEANYFFSGYENTDDLIDKCSFIQSVTYKSMFEEMRRQWPRCSMALNWCLNEPWPTAANNSIINWPAIPKECYYYIKDALRPQIASLRVTKHRWDTGEEFIAEAWLINEKLEVIKSGSIRIYMEINGIKDELLNWAFKDIAAQSNLKGPSVNIILPQSDNKIFTLYIEVEGREELNSTYKFILRNTEITKLKNIMNL